jgi:hypothetical protein
MENDMFEIAALCAIILLYVLRLLYKAKRDHQQWLKIDSEWKPAPSARRSTNEFEGHS